MEHQKILNLLNKANYFKFVERKRNFVNDNSKAKYNVRNEIIYKVLKSNLCDYNDAYILVRGDISITGHQATQVTFKKCTPFTKCVAEVYEILIDDAKYLDLVMPINNLIEYSSNYSETTGSLRFYFKDEATNFKTDVVNDDKFKSFKYNAKWLENTVADGANAISRNETIAVPLNYLSNFWRSLEMPIINCKVELKLKWTKYCILSAAGADVNGRDSNITFTIKDTKLYNPVVTLSAKNN